MADEKITEETVEVDEIEAPVSAICNNAEELAADLVDDDSEIKPVEGFFLTSQRCTNRPARVSTEAPSAPPT